MKILFMTINSNIQGPLPKHNPILIREFEKQGAVVIRSSWGRHSENENILQKVFGRSMDLIKGVGILISKRPDVIYIATTLNLNSLLRDIPLLVMICWSSAKKVLKMHGSEFSKLVKPGHSVFKFFTWLLIKLSNAVLLLSTKELQEWKTFETGGIYFRVDNPFEPKIYENYEIPEISEKTAQINLLYIGRLIKPKGILDLMDAMPLILARKQCHLTIAGEGAEKEVINRKIKEYGLENSVSLPGYLGSKDLSALIKKSSILILPTYCDEGFPTSITEAMYFGLGIVTTPVGGIADHLVDEVNALFIEPKNPEAIANAVCRLIDNPELCQKMCQENQIKVQEFNPEIVASKYIEIFNQLLSPQKYQDASIDRRLSI